MNEHERQTQKTAQRGEIHLLEAKIFFWIRIFKKKMFTSRYNIHL